AEPDDQVAAEHEGDAGEERARAAHAVEARQQVGGEARDPQAHQRAPREGARERQRGEEQVHRIEDRRLHARDEGRAGEAVGIPEREPPLADGRPGEVAPGDELVRDIEGERVRGAREAGRSPLGEKGRGEENVRPARHAVAGDRRPQEHEERDQEEEPGEEALAPRGGHLTSAPSSSAESAAPAPRSPPARSSTWRSAGDRARRASPPASAPPGAAPSGWSPPRGAPGSSASTRAAR